MPNTGACGIDCGGCAAYKATQAKDQSKLAELAKSWGGDKGWSPEDMMCDGCTSGRTYVGCKGCAVWSCAQAKGAGVCSRCGDYPCGKLEGAWKSSNLDAVTMKGNLERAK